MPERIQLKRTKGWKMPPNTVKVDRSTPWGNPHPWREYLENAPAALVIVAEREAWAKRMAVDALREDLASGHFTPPLHELRGKNLACWCEPGQPCHADVLLELANESAGK